MAYLADIQSPGNVKDVRQVMDYLRQLEDQLRYVIQHIGAENIQPNAIGEEQLSLKVKDDMKSFRRTMKDMGRSLSSYRQTAEEIALEVRRIAEDGVEKVNNSALTINSSGIDKAVFAAVFLKEVLGLLPECVSFVSQIHNLRHLLSFPRCVPVHRT